MTVCVIDYYFTAAYLEFRKGAARLFKIHVSLSYNVKAI